MAGQGGQQAVLGRGQDDGVAVDGDLLVGEVDVEGAVVEGGDRVVARDLAAADGLEPGQQLDPAEGLGQVVVGPGVEPPHLVPLGPERGQHEDGHVAHVPDPLEDLPAVEVGQPDVEDHDVGVALVELADAVPALDGLRDREALPLEQGPQELADVGLVLDDQHGDVTVSHQAATVLGKQRSRVRDTSPNCERPDQGRNGCQIDESGARDRVGAEVLVGATGGCSRVTRMTTGVPRARPTQTVDSRQRSERCAGPGRRLPRIAPTDGGTRPAHLFAAPSPRCPPVRIRSPSSDSHLVAPLRTTITVRLLY